MAAKEYVTVLVQRRGLATVLVMKDVPQLVPGQQLFEQPDTTEHFYDFVYLSRELRTQYLNVANELYEVMHRVNLVENADLIVDATNVGEGVVDLLREKGLQPISIITTGTRIHKIYEGFESPFSGPAATRLNIRILKEIHVPKSDLVAAGQLLVQQEQVRVSSKLELAEEAQRQFKSFRGKINERTKHKAYEAETAEEHDDIVICFLLGSWWFVSQKDPQLGQTEYLERRLADRISKDSEARGAGTLDWEPLDYF